MSGQAMTVIFGWLLGIVGGITALIIGFFIRAVLGGRL